mmetsp:Transcript_24506/g.55984  ORF Transcript_24506/g.55984 Transcript_24506/m.55984 type:complete len:308 (-) Transcript_24506:987-1910(-)
MLTLLMASPPSTFCNSIPVAGRLCTDMASTFCLTMTPCSVTSKISSLALTILKHLEASSDPALNLMAMTPTPPLPLALKSSVSTRLPYPPSVTMSTNVSSSPFSPAATMLMSTSRSPSFSFMDLTPRLVRPVGRRSAIRNRVASPLAVPSSTSSDSSARSHHRSTSPSSREAMMSPREVILAKASRGVLLIHPLSVASTMHFPGSEKSVTGRMAAASSPRPTGRTEGRGAPRAVRANSGTRWARIPKATPLWVMTRRVSWSLQVKQWATSEEEASRSSAEGEAGLVPRLPRVPRFWDSKEVRGMRLM